MDNESTTAWLRRTRREELHRMLQAEAATRRALAARRRAPAIPPTPPPQPPQPPHGAASAAIYAEAA